MKKSHSKKGIASSYSSSIFENLTIFYKIFRNFAKRKQNYREYFDNRGLHFSQLYLICY